MIYSHHHIIDMAYTQINIKVTGRWVIYSHHNSIDMAYTQIDIKVTGRLAGDRER